MDLSTESSKRKRTYFRLTTASQRRLLFEEAESLDNICEAARRAHTSRGTYYYWRKRYKTAGIAGLSEERSHAPHRTRIAPISQEIKDAVVEYHSLHPEAGCRTVAFRIRQTHGKKVISHTKVWEIIREAKASQSTLKVKAERKSRNPVAGMSAVHAPEPNKTINIDLCVVPITHSKDRELAMVTLSEATVSKPAVESDGESSVKESVAGTHAPASCPGQVFTCEEATYEDQMEAYMIHREEKLASKSARKHHRREKQAKQAELNARSLELRVKRRQQRKTRQAEDDAWREKKKFRQAAKAELKRLSKQKRRSRKDKDACQSQQTQWQTDKSAHQQQMQQRASEDNAWREERQKIRSKTAVLFPALSLTTAWIAILVVVDNCTRECIGVPLFVAGAHVTAEMIIPALIMLCRAGLKYVISDNGPQFIAEIFKQAIKNVGCIPVRISPGRPCTNGIAERFVRTLKEWLEPHSWNDSESLEPLLVEFKEFYNDRPHQGRELKGLSPNEYGRQLECLTC